MQASGVLEGALVVAAWPPELDGLDEIFPARAIGVGLVEAAAGLERALAELRPARVVLVGTAGAFGGGAGAGAIVVARGARLILREGEYAPQPMVLDARADAPFAESLAKKLNAPLVEVTSPLGITQTDAEAARLRAMGGEVEQLECFAVLRACARAAVPATAIFAIANRVGANAATEWRQNRVAAEAAAKSAIRKALG